MPVSDVIAAFLGGQSQQNDILQAAQAVLDKRKQNEMEQKRIDELIRQHDTEAKQFESRMQLDKDLFDLQHKKAQWDVTQAIREGLRSGTIKPQGIESPDNTQFLPNMQQTVEGPFGPVTVAMPGTETEDKLNFAKLMIPIEQKLAEVREAPKAAARVAELERKLESAKEIQGMKDEFSRYAADLRAKTAEELGQMRASQQMQHMLMNMGFSGPEDMKKLVLQHAHDQAVGIEDPSSVKGTALGNLVENAKKNLGLTDLSGGAKTRAAIFSLGTEGSKLLNDFDNLNKLYPASPTLTGKAGQKLKTLPLIGQFTDLGQEYNKFESNLMNYAKTTAGITSSRLLDSNKEQSRFMGSLPRPTDNVAIRNEKRLSLVDNLFTHIDAAISGLSTEQKKHFWTETLKNNETFINLGTDPVFRNNVIKKVLETGNYDSSYLNPMKRSGK